MNIREVDELLCQKDEVINIVRDGQYNPESWKNELDVMKVPLIWLKLEALDFP